MPESFDAQLGEIVAADGIGQHDLHHGFAQGAVCDGQFDMHFGFAAEPGDAESESTAVDPNGLAERVIAFEDGSEFEWEDGGVTEAAANHAGVLDNRLLVERGRALVELAHNHSKFTAGIAEDRGSVHALNILYNERASGTGAVGERVWCSVRRMKCGTTPYGTLRTGTEADRRPLMFFGQLKLQVWKFRVTSGTGLKTLGNLFSSPVMHITSE